MGTECLFASTSIYLIPDDRYPKRFLPQLLCRCAPACISKKKSYKLEIFSDSYASPKFIPHEIFLTEIYVNEKKANYGIIHLGQVLGNHIFISYKLNVNWFRFSL